MTSERYEREYEYRIVNATGRCIAGPYAEEVSGLVLEAVRRSPDVLSAERRPLAKWESWTPDSERCPTCGSDDPKVRLDEGFDAAEGTPFEGEGYIAFGTCPDPWHGGTDDQ